MKVMPTSCIIMQLLVIICQVLIVIKFFVLKEMERYIIIEN